MVAVKEILSTTHRLALPLGPAAGCSWRCVLAAAEAQVEEKYKIRGKLVMNKEGDIILLSLETGKLYRCQDLEGKAIQKNF